MPKIPTFSSEVRLLMESASCRLEILTKGTFFRVTPIAPNDSSVREHTVIFVHGFKGDALGTWKKKGAAESFPSLLATDPDLVDHGFYIFQYRARFLNPQDIESVVAQLKLAINQHLKKSRIVFLAHSMGGLVSMRYLSSYLEEGRAHPVGGILLYGCPMSGVEWVKYARTFGYLAGLKFSPFRWLGSLLNANKQLKALTTGSEFLDRLNNDWIKRVVNGGHHELNAEQRAWVPVRVVSGNDDWVVKKSSARAFYSSIDWIELSEDHRSLVKPAARDEQSYAIAKTFLADCRNWLSPSVLTGLREHMDDISRLHQKTRVSNQTFDLVFEAKPFAQDHEGAFGLPGHRPFDLQCSYRRFIKSDSLLMAFSIGPLAFESFFKKEFDDQIAFLHGIRLEALAPKESQEMSAQLQSIILSGETGWARLFDNVRVNLSAQITDKHELLPGPVDPKNGVAIRRFSFPQEAKHFVGREAVVDVSFRGLLSPPHTGYTVRFPWLAEGFRATVSVKGNPKYFIAVPGMLGKPKIEIEREFSNKIQLSSKDLILPGSFIRFEWQLD
jgi:pimeloyl-ACP methyl ester carboxylesterase